MVAYKCRDCNKEKPVSDFYKEESKRGHTKYCRECLRKRRKQHREDNREALKQRRASPEHKKYHREAMREWRINNPDKAKDVRQKYFQANKEDYRKRVAQYRMENPEIEHAHNLVKSALRSGKMQRAGVCSACGIQCKTNAHHKDYSKPYDVTWLCRSCHAMLHKGTPEAAHRVASFLGVRLKEDNDD